MNNFPCLVRSSAPGGEHRYRLGDPLVDSYLAFVAGRCRPNTLRAVAHDLKTFFAVIPKAPADVAAADVFDFVAHQRGDRTVVRMSDRESGLSARTIARRLSTVSGLYAYLLARGDCGVRANPVPRGLSTRHRGGRRQQVPLVRVPRTLPKVLAPEEVRALVAALRTARDTAMVYAMVLGGLRRCEVLGLRLGDVRVPERSLYIAEGKGGHHRVVPISPMFLDALGGYLRDERPAGRSDRVFVTLKGPTRGEPMTADGVDQVLRGAYRRAGLRRLTCHQLRHTCLTRLHEAGMAIEAVQAQAGHASIESTMVYVHLADTWLAGEYRQAAARIDADQADELAKADVQ